jgi:hypothetical protein
MTSLSDPAAAEFLADAGSRFHDAKLRDATLLHRASWILHPFYQATPL